MKIYLAATAPGREKSEPLIIKRRLLSFYFIYNCLMEADIVFNLIRKK